jgi:hypothetical protein
MLTTSDSQIHDSKALQLKYDPFHSTMHALGSSSGAKHAGKFQSHITCVNLNMSIFQSHDRLVFLLKGDSFHWTMRAPGGSSGAKHARKFQSHITCVNLNMSIF